jgi:hypothetical protein
MRLSQFALTDEPAKSKQALYHATVEVVGKASGRLSPLEINNLIVRFPLLNCAVSDARGTAIRGTDDCGQHVGIIVEVGLFCTDEARFVAEVEGCTCVDIVAGDTTVTLLDPQINFLSDVSCNRHQPNSLGLL